MDQDSTFILGALGYKCELSGQGASPLGHLIAKTVAFGPRTSF